MKIDDNSVFLTLPASRFCDAPDKFTDFDLKIVTPSDPRLPAALVGLFGPSPRVFDSSGNLLNSLFTLDREEWIYIPRHSFLDKISFSFADVVEILATLRGDNGCSWDRAQTHESIRSNLIEEAYELVDAIDLKDTAKIAEETGDLLLQAVFHMTIAEETGEFSFSDVYGALCRKLIFRHTHIFGDDKASTGEEALAVWEKNKLKEKQITGAAQNLGEVPKGMPALLRAFKVQKRAAKYGVDFDNVIGAWDKLVEELSELKTAFESGNFAETEKEAGDVLFAAVNVLRFMKAEPEIALNRSTEKFTLRVTYLENALRERGENFDDYTANKDFLWELWNEAKRSESK